MSPLCRNWEFLNSSNKFDLSEFTNYYIGRVEQLIRDFAVNWKVAIENMNQEVMRSFSNFKNGTNILQVILKFVL